MGGLVKCQVMPKGVPHDNSVKRKILHRLQIARGHLERVIRMVERDDYCVDVIHQSLAVQAALKKSDQAVLENHMKTCVADSIRAGKSRQVIDEVMKVMDKRA